MSLAYEAITGKILEAAFEVSNELGVGFLESVYEGALFMALNEKGIKVERQSPIKVYFRGQLVGQFVTDLLIENQVIVELKTAKAIAPEHIAQTLNYLKATGKPVAMILNFGAPKLEFRRFENKFEGKQFNRDEGDEGDKNKSMNTPKFVTIPTSSESNDQ